MPFYKKHSILPCRLMVTHCVFTKKSCAFLPNLVVGPKFPTFGSQKRKSAREEQFGLPF